MSIRKRIVCLLLCMSLLLLAAFGAAEILTVQHSEFDYVFVHGLSGWGSYDRTYKIMPYWGMFGGDLLNQCVGILADVHEPVTFHCHLCAHLERGDHHGYCQ